MARRPFTLGYLYGPGDTSSDRQSAAREYGRARPLLFFQDSRNEAEKRLQALTGSRSAWRVFTKIIPTERGLMDCRTSATTQRRSIEPHSEAYAWAKIAAAADAGARPGRQSVARPPSIGCFENPQERRSVSPHNPQDSGRLLRRAIG